MNKRYWLRGGIFSVVTILLLYVVWAGIGARELCEFSSVGPSKVCSNKEVIETFFFLIKLPFNNLPYDGLLSTTLPILLAVFSLGAFFGWLYGKISSKGGSA